MARGKTKGATSFIVVSLDQLNNVLKPNANVMVSRKFAEALGLEGTQTTSTKQDIVANSKTVEVETIDF